MSGTQFIRFRSPGLKIMIAASFCFTGCTQDKSQQIASLSSSPAASAETIQSQTIVFNELLTKIYGPYAQSSDTSADWDRPVWSEQMLDLIKKWQKQDRGELTELRGYGWFCECQDWNWEHFSWQPITIKRLDNRKMEVGVRVNNGFASKVDQRLTLIYENERWVVDEVFSESLPQGLQSALHNEITDFIAP